jgi:hypothetical protein
MTHSSQRRGLDAAGGCKELCIIGMIPKAQFNRRGIKSAMCQLARKILEHAPDNFIFRDFTEITIPNLGAAQKLLEWLHKRRPALAHHTVLWILAHTRSGLSAVYSDIDTVKDLIKELAGQWRSKNRKKGWPVSIVLSGLPEDIRACCQEAGLTEHTFLHSLDVFGTVQKLPSEDELSLITMCGHGLVASARVKHLVERIRKGKLTPEEAAEDIARPCVCGIVNKQRAEQVFARLASSAEPGK